MPASLVVRSHPRRSRPAFQLAVLAVAVAAGCLLGGLLLTADRSSWRGATATMATVVGRSHTGVLAHAGDRRVVLHLARIPPVGTRIAVEVTADGRARPLAYRQTPGGAVGSGVLVTVGLTALVQAYRFVVTGRPVGDRPTR